MSLKAENAQSKLLRWTYTVSRSTLTGMIKSSASSAMQHFLDTGKSKFSGLDVEKAKRRIVMLNNARSLEDISPLKSVGLHKLAGDRKGQWAIIINGPWRLCFRFEDGHAFDVEIVDYH